MLGIGGSAVALLGLGLSAGLMTVPLLAYIQSRTPEEQRGRIIGAMNLANWIGIAAAGQYYAVSNIILRGMNVPYQTMFAAAALLLLPLLILFHPESEPLSMDDRPPTQEPAR
jgi:acyl-[acyl-carrier-protein]-phospholipid O-acyltransferase/long-chain-fatty-acid--[acyl-carrier-protein] ligase